MRKKYIICILITLTLFIGIFAWYKSISMFNVCEYIGETIYYSDNYWCTFMGVEFYERAPGITID
jgi:hypothetical protein